jgi:hypothetical protein
VNVVNGDDQWSVSLSVAETGGRTRAEARLTMAGEEQLAGSGEARLNPADQDVWTIGAQVAVARALPDLAGQLLHAAAAGIEQITHERAHLHL